MFKGGNDLFDRSSFLGDLLFRPGDGGHIGLVLTSGFFNANGDFLCACACSKLPGSVANLIYGGWGLIQGTLLTFLVEKYDGSIALLFSGIFTAMLGVISMSASDYFSVDPTTVSSKMSMDFSCFPTADYHTVLVGGSQTDATKSEVNDCDDENDETNSRNGQPQVSVRVVRKYIYLCVLAGVMTGVFAPLSVLASQGSGAVENPYVLMFLFQCGELVAIPFMIFYYSKLFASGARHDGHGGMWQYVEAVGELPKSEFRYGCLAGVAVGVGFFFFFTASEVLPSTISFGISNCAPLITILIDVTLFGHLNNATVYQIRFMFLSAGLFVAAIIQMVLAQSV